MSKDFVVDGHPNDADQPGHNPGPPRKATFWPDVFAVNMTTRDGQHIPIGAVYQGEVEGSNVYALMTVDTTPPPEPITLVGQGCEGTPVEVTAPPGQILWAMQHPDTVYKVQLCDASKDRDKVVLCDSITGDKVAVITKYDNPDPVTTFWNISKGEAWSGDPADLVTCPDIDLESDGMPMCDNGTSFIRWYLKKDGKPVNEYFDTDLGSQPYVVSSESNVTPGECVPGCPPVTYQGVVSEW